MVMVLPDVKMLAGVNTMDTAFSVALFATASTAASVREVPIFIWSPSAGIFPELAGALLVDIFRAPGCGALGEALAPTQLQVNVDPAFTKDPTIATKPLVEVELIVKLPEEELTEQLGLDVNTVPKDTVMLSWLMFDGASRLYDVAVIILPAKVTEGEFPALGLNVGDVIMKSLHV